MWMHTNAYEFVQPAKCPKQATVGQKNQNSQIEQSWDESQFVYGHSKVRLSVYIYMCTREHIIIKCTHTRTHSPQTAAK